MTRRRGFTADRRAALTREAHPYAVGLRRVRPDDRRAVRYRVHRLPQC